MPFQLDGVVAVGLVLIEFHLYVFIRSVHGEDAWLSILHQDDLAVGDGTLGEETLACSFNRRVLKREELLSWGLLR